MPKITRTKNNHRLWPEQVDLIVHNDIHLCTLKNETSSKKYVSIDIVCKTRCKYMSAEENTSISKLVPANRTVKFYTQDLSPKYRSEEVEDWFVSKISVHDVPFFSRPSHTPIACLDLKNMNMRRYSFQFTGTDIVPINAPARLHEASTSTSTSSTSSL